MMQPYKKITLFLMPALFSTLLNAQSFENGFNFNLPFDDSLRVEYLPEFTRKPLTEVDRVSTDSAGNFVVNGKPYRFYGGNLTTEAAFPLKEDAAVIAGR
ncbi:MAG: hypothetical protein KAS29_09195, partial [Bacteroidales bacterium]|nr:hypothetical protein [Bacteroidales bacterium]